MYNLKLISTFKDFSNKIIEKSLNFSCQTDKLNNILSLTINENLISLIVETTDRMLEKNMNEIEFIVNGKNKIRLCEMLNMTCFNYECKTKYIINYMFLEQDQND